MKNISTVYRTENDIKLLFTSYEFSHVNYIVPNNCDAYAVRSNTKIVYEILNEEIYI